MLDPSTISTRGAARAAMDGRPAHRTAETIVSDFDRFIQLGRAWADRWTFWRHLEGRPTAWLQELDWQLLADAVGRPGNPERRLIEAKRARIRGVLRASAAGRRAA
jgi:hypothetical protein